MLGLFQTSRLACAGCIKNNTQEEMKGPNADNAESRYAVLFIYYPACAATRGLKMLVSVVGCRRQCHKQAPS